MRLKKIEVIGFKSFAQKAVMEFEAPITAVVGPNGSGKSNVAEAIRFVLGEQSIKNMRGKKGEDLIFNGSQKTGRLNRAKVTIVFDNRDRGMKIDFDEVSISREVFRDGSHSYYINGSQVRLKDIIELLSSVHIGASSHHIISQGEADRILNASIKERKTMIEDALGLKVYHWKINESEKKLAKTEVNIKEIDMLRREITPQLKYLKKQVEKLEKAKELRNELVGLFKEYLKREDVYLNATQEKLKLKIETLISQKKGLDIEIAETEQTIAGTPRDEELYQKLRTLDERLRTFRVKLSDVNREIGRVEGVIEHEERKTEKKIEKKTEEHPIPFENVKETVDEVKWTIGEALGTDDINHIKFLLKTAEERLISFIEKFQNKEHIESTDEETNDKTLKNLKNKKEILRRELEEIEQKENKEVKVIEEIKKQIEVHGKVAKETERALYNFRTEQNQILSCISVVDGDLARLKSVKERFENEVRSSVNFVGQNASDYHEYKIEESLVMEEERSKQEDRRMKIERIKIRIEDMSGEFKGEDILKEYKDIKDKDSFFDKELLDLSNSASSLRTLIKNLLKQLESEFSAGVEEINIEFQKFFTLMFGGGSAVLSVVTKTKSKNKNNQEIQNSNLSAEVELVERGVDIEVTLPRKKTKGLVMLSGGERALTSIALLFAMSQVKPPPFLILDETDAALDEANSRKYGDMLENLSKFSQLIVVTHNRETMGRAGILYGITMGSDATSKLLSIKFEEAVEVAK